MSVFNIVFDVVIAGILALLIGVPVVMLFEKAKKEMDESEENDDV